MKKKHPSVLHIVWMLEISLIFTFYIHFLLYSNIYNANVESYLISYNNKGYNRITKSIDADISPDYCLGMKLNLKIRSGALPGKMLDLGLLKISWGVVFPKSSPCGGT